MNSVTNRAGGTTASSATKRISARYRAQVSAGTTIINWISLLSIGCKPIATLPSVARPMAPVDK